MVVVDGLMHRPIPVATTISPGSTDQYPPSAETIMASSARPTANSPTPSNSTLRVPMRSAMVGATADSGIMTTIIGSSEPAAASAE